MPRPWTMFVWVLGFAMAYAFLEGYLTWPQRIVLGLAFALMLWRLAYKFRKAIKSMREGESPQ